MISAILLAAGQSKRMKGSNKLLFKYKNKTLINYILKSLVKSKVNKIIVVLGYEGKKVKIATIKSKKIKGLYFTGQLTVPGPGVPPSLISGKIVSKTIMQDFPNQ